MKSFKSLFISDIHIGAGDNNIKKVNKLLSESKFENLFLVGDIVDGWRLKKKWKWKKAYGEFIKLLQKKKSEGVNITYITGNHDDFLREFTPFDLYLFSVRDEVIYNKTLIIHGDKFDKLIHDKKYLYMLGDYGYNVLIWLDRLFGLNGRMSKRVKQYVKTRLNYLNDFYHTAAEYAKRKGCTSIICGHTHMPEHRIINGVEYWNCGDFREGSSYIIEDDGYRLSEAQK
jgi:UDP-2,3-diacylglucosamine pyrophosphatase LpxH